MDIFSARIKWLRNKKGLTQAQVAESIGMSTPGYTKVEQGTREMKFEILAKLPDVLGESLDFMLGVTDFDKSASSKIEQIMFLATRISEISKKQEMLTTMSIEEVNDDMRQRLLQQAVETKRRVDELIKEGARLKEDAVESLKHVPLISQESIEFIAKYDLRKD